MKSNIPNFKVDTSNGSVALVFQTTSHTCKLKFVNQTFTIEVDNEVVFSADKLN